MSDVNLMADEKPQAAPGPWTLTSVSTEYGMIHTVRDAKGKDVCDQFDEPNATGRLIAAAPELLQGMKDLYRAYVNLLEAGRDRIATYGGQCDSVEVMERGDPWLNQARDVVAKAEGQSCA